MHPYRISFKKSTHMKNRILSALFFLLAGTVSVKAQSGQVLTASADLPGVQQHALFNTRPANFFIYAHNVNPNGQIDYIIDNHHNHNHNEVVLNGTLKRYAYALAPNVAPASDQQIIDLYASMITARGGTVYINSLQGARMEVAFNGLNHYVMVVPSGGGTQYEVIVFEYDPNQQ